MLGGALPSPAAPFFNSALRIRAGGNESAPLQTQPNWRRYDQLYQLHGRVADFLDTIRRVPCGKNTVVLFLSNKKDNRKHIIKKTGKCHILFKIEQTAFHSAPG